MVCKNCGIANSDASRFCSECGSVLPRPKSQPAAEQSVKNETVPPVAQPLVMPYMPQPPVAGFAPPVLEYAMPIAQQMHMPVYTQAPPFAPPEPPRAPQAAPVYEQRAPENVPPAAAVPPPAQTYVPQNPGAFAAPYPVSPMPYAPPMYPFGYSPLFKDPNASKMHWALALSILAVVLPIITCSFASPIALIAGVAGISLAAANMNKVFVQNRSKAIAAVIVGIVGTLISIFGISVLLRAAGTLTSSDEFKRFQEDFNSMIAFVMFKAYRVCMVAVKAVMVQLQVIGKFLLLK